MSGSAGYYSANYDPMGFNFTASRTSGTGGNTVQRAPSSTSYGPGTTAQGTYGYGPASGMYSEDDRLDVTNQFNQMNAGFEHQRRMQQAQLDAQSQQARFAADQRAQALGGLQSMFAEAKGSWGQPMPAPQFTPVQVQQASLPAQKTIGAPDMAAAQQAQFARAKDQAGEVARSALAGLRSQLGGRNLLGSGAEHRGTVNVANKGVQQLGELSRDQAIQGSEANQQAALANFQGGVTQRAQDIGANQWVHQFNAQQQAAAQQASLDWQLRQQAQQQDQQMKFMDMIMNSISRY